MRHRFPKAGSNGTYSEGTATTIVISRTKVATENFIVK